MRKKIIEDYTIESLPLKLEKNRESRTAKQGSNSYRTHKETKRNDRKIEFMCLKMWK